MINWLISATCQIGLAIWFIKIAFTEDLDNKTFWALIFAACVAILTAVFDYCAYLKRKQYE